MISRHYFFHIGFVRTSCIHELIPNSFSFPLERQIWEWIIRDERASQNKKKRRRREGKADCRIKNNCYLAFFCIKMMGLFCLWKGELIHYTSSCLGEIIRWNWTSKFKLTSNLGNKDYNLVDQVSWLFGPKETWVKSLRLGPSFAKKKKKFSSAVKPVF